MWWAVEGAKWQQSRWWLSPMKRHSTLTEILSELKSCSRVAIDTWITDFIHINGSRGMKTCTRSTMPLLFVFQPSLKSALQILSVSDRVLQFFSKISITSLFIKKHIALFFCSAVSIKMQWTCQGKNCFKGPFNRLNTHKKPIDGRKQAPLSPEEAVRNFYNL